MNQTQKKLLPYYGQIASPELAEKIFSGELPAEKDPKWAEFGVSSPEEYTYWVERACGIACVKMVVEGLGGKKYNMIDWINKGLSINAYLIREKDGKKEEIGWIHSGLAQLITNEGFSAAAVELSFQDLVDVIRENKICIASVSYEIGTVQSITRNSGHLVVVHGIEFNGEEPEFVILNNPSGRTADLQKDARIPTRRFKQAFSTRGIIVSQ